MMLRISLPCQNGRIKEEIIYTRTAQNANIYWIETKSIHFRECLTYHPLFIKHDQSFDLEKALDKNVQNNKNRVGYIARKEVLTHFI